MKTSTRPENLINLSHPKMRLNDNLNKSLNIIQIHINKDKDFTEHPEEVNLDVAEVPHPHLLFFPRITGLRGKV